MPPSTRHVWPNWSRRGRGDTASRPAWSWSRRSSSRHPGCLVCRRLPRSPPSCWRRPGRSSRTCAAARQRISPLPPAVQRWYLAPLPSKGPVAHEDESAPFPCRLRSLRGGASGLQEGPERARVYHIFLPAKEAKEKAQAKTKAATLVKEMREREKKGEPNVFEKTAMKESKDQLSAALGGDLRFLSKDELAKAHGTEMANAAFDLKNPGEIAGPIETPNGIEIVKLQVKTVALNRGFDEAKDAIRGRMARDRRSKQYDDFVKKLEDEGKVSIDEVELAKITPTEAGAPVGTPLATPAPGSPAPATAKIGGN